MDTVIVGCRHPHGLILRLFDMVDSREAAGAGRYETVKVARPRPQTVTLNGWIDRRIPVAVDGKGQYGVTRDVPAAFFAEWMEQNKDSRLVTGGIVFGAAKENEVKAQAKDYRGELTGIEPLDAAKPGERYGMKKIVPAKPPETATA